MSLWDDAPAAGSTKEKMQVLYGTRRDFNIQTCSGTAQVIAATEIKGWILISDAQPKIQMSSTGFKLSPGITAPSKAGCKDHHGHQKLQPPPKTLPVTISLSLVSAIRASTRKPWPDSSNAPRFSGGRPENLLIPGSFGLEMLNTHCSAQPPKGHLVSASLGYGQRSSRSTLSPKSGWRNPQKSEIACFGEKRPPNLGSREHLWHMGCNNPLSAATDSAGRQIR